jgi:predicted nucleic acid-binding protein
LSGMVIDASVALAWGFPDETSDYADRVLVALEGQTILVPALWATEIANAVLVAERRKRIRQPEIRRFVELLGNLTVAMDSQTVTESVGNILPLGREYGLSAYDAAYLDVAMRYGAPLATLDGNLQKAGRKAGIGIFGSA